jgi:hypothetical protein
VGAALKVRAEGDVPSRLLLAVGEVPSSPSPALPAPLAAAPATGGRQGGRLGAGAAEGRWMAEGEVPKLRALEAACCCSWISRKEL